MSITLALSALCENPSRRTGLSTLFHEFVGAGLRLFPDVHWLIFVGPNQPWTLEDPRIRLVRTFPANDRRMARLWADHIRVGPTARALGADVLLTIGFVPKRAPLPIAMHVFALHHLRAGGGLRGVYRRRAIKRGVHRAALVIANSQWTAERLWGATRVEPSKLLVSPEGVQHERFHAVALAQEQREARQTLGLPDSYLLWSSNFYAYKRADRMLAAYAALPAQWRQHYPLVLIGGDWEGGLERARADARRLGIEADTRFLGWVDDRWLPACYRGARAHVLSTAEETFGRSVLEAMACGCACVLQDLPVLREVAGEAGVYVDYQNARQAADAICRVCEDESLHAEKRRLGLARAATFSFERLARERIEAIRRVVGK